VGDHRPQYLIVHHPHQYIFVDLPQ